MLSRIIPDAEDWLERIVDAGLLDAVLLIGQSDQFDTIERVARRYRPLVAWRTHVAGQVHCAVGVDNRGGGGRLAGERPLQLAVGADRAEQRGQQRPDAARASFRRRG